MLITDGVNNSGADPLAVAPQLGANGVEIDTIGIGTNDSGQLIPGTGEEASLDEEALREIAHDAHGTYARAADAGSLRGRLDALAQTTTREQKKVDLALPFAVVAGAILLAAVAAGNALEFYDFLIFGFFAVQIGKAFFPAAGDGGLLLTLQRGGASGQFFLRHA